MLPVPVIGITAWLILLEKWELTLLVPCVWGVGGGVGWSSGQSRLPGHPVLCCNQEGEKQKSVEDATRCAAASLGLLGMEQLLHTSVIHTQFNLSNLCATCLIPFNDSLPPPFNKCIVSGTIKSVPQARVLCHKLKANMKMSTMRMKSCHWEVLLSKTWAESLLTC